MPNRRILLHFGPAFGAIRVAKSGPCTLQRPPLENIFQKIFGSLGTQVRFLEPIFHFSFSEKLGSGVPKVGFVAWDWGQGSGQLSLWLRLRLGGLYPTAGRRGLVGGVGRGWVNVRKSF